MGMGTGTGTRMGVGTGTATHRLAQVEGIELDRLHDSPEDQGPCQMHAREIMSGTQACA